MTDMTLDMNYYMNLLFIY